MELLSELELSWFQCPCAVLKACKSRQETHLPIEISDSRALRKPPPHFRHKRNEKLTKSKKILKHAGTLSARLSDTLAITASFPSRRAHGRENQESPSARPVIITPGTHTHTHAHTRDSGGSGMNLTQRQRDDGPPIRSVPRLPKTRCRTSLVVPAFQRPASTPPKSCRTWAIRSRQPTHDHSVRMIPTSI